LHLIILFFIVISKNKKNYNKEIIKYDLQFIFRGATALGFSLISYGGNLNLSLIADKSIINDEKALIEILEDTVREINHAYKSIIECH